MKYINLLPQERKPGFGWPTLSKWQLGCLLAPLVLLVTFVAVTMVIQYWYRLELQRELPQSRGMRENRRSPEAEKPVAVAEEDSLESRSVAVLSRRQPELMDSLWEDLPPTSSGKGFSLRLGLFTRKERAEE